MKFPLPLESGFINFTGFSSSGFAENTGKIGFKNPFINKEAKQTKYFTRAVML
jgi:hypothetical protein